MWQYRLGGNLPLSSITVYPKKYAHGFVVLCFVVVMQSFIMNSRDVFIQIHQGCFAGTGAIVRLPQCQWSKPDGYGKISQCITTTKHSKAKTVCIFLGMYCTIISVYSMGPCNDKSELKQIVTGYRISERSQSSPMTTKSIDICTLYRTRTLNPPWQVKKIFTTLDYAS